MSFTLLLLRVTSGASEDDVEKIVTATVAVEESRRDFTNLVRDWGRTQGLL